MHKQFALALLVTTAIAVAGCGGSSNNSTPTTTATLSPQHFAAQLSALCKTANAAFSAAPSGSAASAVIAKFVATVRSLKTTPQLQAVFSQYVTVIEQELADLKKGDQAGLYRLAQTKARPLAKQMGATGCVT